MTKIKFYVLALALIMIAIVTACVSRTNNSTTGSLTPDHSYFSGGPQFTHGLRDVNKRLIGKYEGEHGIYFPVLRVKYITKDIFDSVDFKPDSGTVFHFEMLDTGSQVNLSIPSSIAEDIKLSSGAVYQIVSDVEPGWPTAYGLIISQSTELVFVGIADWQVDGQITIDDAFLQISNLPIKAEKTRVLTDHYREDDFGRVTNTEVRFSVDGKSITMHQGESSVIGDYKVSLLIAREVQYKHNVVDGGVNTVSYTISRVSQPEPLATTAPAEKNVYFPDLALNDAIRKTIRTNRVDITGLDLVGLSALKASGLKIKDISGLEHCTTLQWLDLSNNQIEDISPLSNLTNLHYLDLHTNTISDISPLRNLKKLVQFQIQGNQVTDISALAELTSLSYLKLGNNQILDITPLSNILALDNLELLNNQIADISGLSKLVKLRFLYLGNNQITDISPLQGLSELYILSLSHNRITNISALASLTGLGGLHLNDNLISDIGPLVENAGLGRGDSIILRNNPLNDKSVNFYVPELEQRGVEVK